MYVLIFLYFVTRSFYVLPSGNLQPFDAFFIINLIWYFMYKNSTKLLKEVFTNFLYFALWIFIVNTVWFFIDGLDFTYMVNSIFVIYNLLFCVLNIFLYLNDKEKYERFFQLAVLINFGVNLILYFGNIGASLGDGDRTMLFFTDPNQMAYYFFMIAVLSYCMNLKFKHLIGAISAFFVIVSASRGVIVAMILFYTLYASYIIYKKGILFKYVARLLVGLCLILITSAFVDVSKISIFSQFKYMSSRFDENNGDDNLESRGWDRLIDYSEYTIYGYGEGGRDSGEKYIMSYRPDIETHSTWANIIMSYGIIGLFLFILIFKQCFRFQDYMYYIPFVMHGMVQVDSRQTTFWLLMFLLFVKNNYKQISVQNDP